MDRIVRQIVFNRANSEHEHRFTIDWIRGVPTVLSGVPTVLSSVPTVLSDVPTEASDVSTELSDVPTVLLDAHSVLPDERSVLSELPIALSSVTAMASEASCSLSRFIIFAKKVFPRPTKEIKLNKIQSKPRKSETTKNGAVCVGEGKSKKLSCPAGETLLIDDAIYGMMTPKGCPSPGLNIRSKAEKSLPIVWKACQGLQHCTVTASNRIFGYPFFDTKKYLWVAYRCFPG
ncbi:hypothetical protein Bbelb_411390 [Branchiostoma belcheri]|nr:hypothetical protein Bbelb_411390 [Branchiostoma belcheri]